MQCDGIGPDVTPAPKEAPLVQTTPTTATASPTGAPACQEVEPSDPSAAQRAAAAAEAEARGHWLATAAWPEVVFASA
jgi:hypothetical protein